MKHAIWKKLTGLLLCTAILSGVMQSPQTAQAAEQTLLLSQAKVIALANSDTYRRIKSKISLKEVSYKQAVKSMQLKIRNKTTFRWSPLLSFKFPEKLNMEDQSNMVYKPAQIQTEITKLRHDLTDEVYNTYDKTMQAYISAYTYQEKIAFEEEQLSGLQETLEKNKGRLILGLASQADVDAMEKNITAAKEKLAQDMKEFENAKTKLGDLLELDVTTRYRFYDPYVDAEVPRTALEDLIAYTLENDQAYYEAKMDTQLSYLQLETNHSLLTQQYGGKMSTINPFIMQAKNGDKVDSDAFKQAYDAFLQRIDAPWNGKWKILFFRFPKEWLKGSIDGTRYVEDEPYVLYENVLEYQDTLAEQKSMAKELETQVRDSFESVTTARGSYLKLKAQVAEYEDQLRKELVLNRMGDLTFEEYTESQSQYEELQIETMEAFETYTSLISSLDRLTCGGVSKYFKDAGISMDSSEGGNSYIVDEEAVDGARYYIRSIIEDNMFAIGIYLPQDFETDVTHFELWVDDYVVGERTEVGKQLRHLTLSLKGDERVFLRLYNDTEFVEDCEIDPQSYEGPLDIKNYAIAKAEEQQKRQIGSYEIKSQGEMGTVEVEITIDGVEDVHYYALKNEQGTFLLKKEPTPIASPFLYLDFLSEDMDFLILQCYDSAKAEKFEAHFDTADYSIYVNEQ